MKLKDGIIITEAGGTFVAVAAGEAGRAFNGMIKMNGTAAFIAEKLKTENDADGLAAALCEHYEVDLETARASVDKVVESFRQVHLLEE